MNIEYKNKENKNKFLLNIFIAITILLSFGFAIYLFFPLMVSLKTHNQNLSYTNPPYRQIDKKTEIGNIDDIILENNIKEKIKEETKDFDSQKNSIALNSQKNILDKTQKTKVYIVIDDVGYNVNSLKDFLTLKIPLTFAVIPSLPNTKKSIEMISQTKNEIIIHQPMESYSYPGLESSGIRADFSDEQIDRMINKNIDEFGSVAKGMNNHMGSLITENKHIMELVISNLEKRNMFFLDSFTTKDSVVGSVYKKYQKRDIFLDNEKSYNYIENQFEYSLVKLKNKKDIVMIGHNGTYELIRYLKDNQDKLMLMYDFLPVSKLFNQPNEE